MHTQAYSKVYFSPVLSNKEMASPSPLQSLIFKDWEAEVVAWGAGWYEAKCGSSFYYFSLGHASFSVFPSQNF